MNADTYASFLLDFVNGKLKGELALAAELHCLLHQGGADTTRLWQAARSSFTPPRPAEPTSFLPEALELAASDHSAVPWKRGLTGVHYAKRGNGNGQLMRLDPGQSAPRHSHSALEATLVLKGSFSDGHGTYQRGDIVLAGPGYTHRPVTEGNDPCICFIARDTLPFWRLS